jgi:hypothetical protein
MSASPGIPPAAARPAGSDQSLGSVMTALAANTAIALANGIAAALTGSPALLAETLRTVADAGNDIFLYVAIRRSRLPADTSRPFGYGPERFYWALLAAIGSSWSAVPCRSGTAPCCFSPTTPARWRLGRVAAAAGGPWGRWDGCRGRDHASVGFRLRWAPPGRVAARGYGPGASPCAPGRDRTRTAPDSAASIAFLCKGATTWRQLESASSTGRQRPPRLRTRDGSACGGWSRAPTRARRRSDGPPGSLSRRAEGRSACAVAA